MLLALGIGLIAFAGLLTYIAYTADEGVPGRGYYRIDVRLADADNLTANNEVRAGGRLIGVVGKTRIEDGEPVAELRLNGDVKPLRSDTLARVRPRSPIGVRFLELTPGGRGRPLDDGDTLPSRQSSAAVPLDDALDTLDARRRGHVRTLLRELGTGAIGRGDDVSEAFGAGPEMLRDTGRVSRAIADRTGAAADFVAGIADALDALDPVRQPLAQGFEPAARALRPFNVEGDALRETLAVAPSALRGAQAGLARTDPLLSQVDRLARAALPALDRAIPALGQTNALIDESHDGLRRLPASLGRLDRAVGPTTALLRRVVPTLPAVDAAAQRALRPLGNLAPRGCEIKEFGNNWGDFLNYGNQEGAVLRFMGMSSAEALANLDTSKLPTGVRPSEAYPEPCTGLPGGRK